ncbi:hypothetical protein Tco_1406140 [Tanacetum coccineum]
MPATPSPRFKNNTSCVEEADHDIEVAHMDNNPYVDLPIPEPTSVESFSHVVILNNVYSVNQPPEHNNKWTKDHPIDNVIESCWIEAMQEELNEFERIEVYEMVPRLDRVILKKHGMDKCDSIDTPMATQPN